MPEPLPAAPLTKPGAPRGGPLLLPPNRVWRSYLGGRTLDALAGAAAPADGHFPEDWVGSVTRAINPGREHLVEGPSTVVVGNQRHDLATLLAREPEYLLGREHVARFGAQPQLLVKLLDAAIRLHFQVHPTAEFARRRLGALSGKTEAYHVLATRPEVAAPCIYLGFQRPPTRDQLREWITTQNLAALAACFDPVPVRPGDTVLVPGGVPHALSAGVLLVEVQEPSDLVVRFEFERGGHVLPESARFMGRGLEFCLDVFDLSPWPRERIQAEAFCAPRWRRALGGGSWQEDLIGPGQTPCFRVRRSVLLGPVTKHEDGFHLAIVTRGACTLHTTTGPRRLGLCDTFLVPAGLGPLAITPEPTCEILECHPPLPQ